ncbi:biliverdin-producing heme oxygenase [Flavobacterium agricola]|uniref:Biliverdin-producing heme oxygenase n=1 Tax=Flavobacterium agricola TaxID=2870839 RepID=A0ABY6LZZ9_9FLAO|nr:biliverdin-producing heme oxygenase [Flavobacterium agricola]UYW01152.1 biliverdin-producing heme oxygenase [Flavobacterium agricola]
MTNAQILKTETETLHDQVELVMNSALLFTNQFNLSHYKHFIQKSYNYVNFLQPIILTNWPDFQALLSAKEKALTTDLQHLSLPVKPDVDLSVASTNKYFQLGLIYIVLGAMLGNKVILNKLHKFEEFQGFPFAYLSHRPENLSEMWKAFQADLNELSAEQLEQVIAGAKKGYALFGA